MAYRTFEELDVWKASCQLAVDVYSIMEGTREFGLRDQMTRAAVSIASNIAEGAERNTPADFARFLHIAKGSAAELRTQLYIARRIGAISPAQQRPLTQTLKRISSQLQRLATSLKPKIQNPKPKT